MQHQQLGELMSTALTPRLAIDAALFLGDAITLDYCPTGLSNAGGEQLSALVAAAIAAGLDTTNS